MTTETDADFPVISPCRQTLISEARNLLIGLSWNYLWLCFVSFV